MNCHSRLLSVSITHLKSISSRTGEYTVFLIICCTEVWNLVSFPCQLLFSMGAALLIIAFSFSIQLLQECISLSFLEIKPAILNFIQFHLHTIAFTTQCHYVLERFQDVAIRNLIAAAYLGSASRCLSLPSNTLCYLRCLSTELN